MPGASLEKDTQCGNSVSVLEEFSIQRSYQICTEGSACKGKGNATLVRQVQEVPSVAERLVVKLLQWVALAGSFGREGHVVVSQSKPRTISGDTVNDVRRPQPQCEIIFSHMISPISVPLEYFAPFMEKAWGCMTFAALLTVTHLLLYLTGRHGAHGLWQVTIFCQKSIILGVFFSLNFYDVNFFHDFYDDDIFRRAVPVSIHIVYMVSFKNKFIFKNIK